MNFDARQGSRQDRYEAPSSGPSAQAWNGKLDGAVVTGTLADISLADLLQAIQIAREDALISVTVNGQGSRIWCSAGAIVDAESGRVSAEAAVYRILSFAQGWVVVEWRSSARERVINVSTNILLLQAAQRKDVASSALRSLIPTKVGVPLQLTGDLTPPAFTRVATRAPTLRWRWVVLSAAAVLPVALWLQWRASPEYATAAAVPVALAAAAVTPERAPPHSEAARFELLPAVSPAPPIVRVVLSDESSAAAGRQRPRPDAAVVPKHRASSAVPPAPVPPGATESSLFVQMLSE